jgi:outer membrane lipoprotein-sorting protein
MRKILGIMGLTAVAVWVVAQSGAGVLSNFAKALSSAESLTVNYTIQRIGGTKDEYTVAFARPNLVRIDKPNELIVADGKTITTYDKAAKTYFKRPQTDEEIRGLVSADEFNLWSAFFDANVFAKTPSKNLGTKNRKGMNLSAIETTPMQGKTVTLYINQGDNLARQAEIVMAHGSDRVSYVLDTKAISITGADSSLFAFKAPEGSRELTLEEMTADKWYTDFEEAKKVAARTNRLLLVDFYADW